MTATTQPKLATRLVNVMTAIGFIPKSGHNDFHNYDFVTDADVLDALRVKLAENGVATAISIDNADIIQFKTDKEKVQFLVTVNGSIAFTDGVDTITIGIAGQGADGSDKGIYKAITGAVKYGLLKTFLVPTGDDPERDTAGEKGTEGPSTTSSDSPASSTTGLTQRQKALLFARFKEAGIEGDQRKGMTLMVAGKHSTSQMNDEDLDKVLEALKNPELVENAKVFAVTQTEEKAA